jgi:hypothetical protein
MKTIFKIAILLFFISMFVSACREKESYPPEPILTYSGFTMFQTPDGADSFGVMTISYTDGDGDLGMYPNDSNPNFFVAYYKMVDGILKIGTRYNPTTGEIDTINFNARIPMLVPPYYTSWIKGEIEDTINPISDPTSQKPYDTIMFEAYVVDRSGNKSNTVQTPLIVVKNQ